MDESEITLLAFASARESLGFSTRSLAVNPQETPLDIIRRLAPDASIENLRVALDSEFADWDTPVGRSHELAFLPPVSGG
jgi:molybdopterin synthase sulfur carrier subunit